MNDGGTRLTSARGFLGCWDSCYLDVHIRIKDEPELSPKLKKWNRFCGREGVAMGVKFPTGPKECAMFANFNYSYVKLKTSSSDLQMIKYVNVLF